MPAPCQITSGYTLGCRDNIGSIKNIFILSGSVTAVVAPTEGLITQLSGSGSFFKFELFRETSDFAETMTVTPENGTIVYETTTNAVFFKMQVSTRNQIRLLSGNPNIKMIVETNNTDATSRFIYVGRDNGVTLTTSAGGSGTGFNDRNGYALTFVSRELEPALFLSASTYSGLPSLLNGLTIQTGSAFGPA